MPNFERAVHCEACDSKVRWITREELKNGSLEMHGICKCRDLIWVSDEFGDHPAQMPAATFVAQAHAQK